MAYYDFKCPDCGQKLEVEGSVHNVPRVMHCRCGRQMDRVFTPINFNTWFCDYSEMNAEKEATDAGFYE